MTSVWEVLAPAVGLLGFAVSKVYRPYKGIRRELAPYGFSRFRCFVCENRQAATFPGYFLSRHGMCVSWPSMISHRLGDSLAGASMLEASTVVARRLVAMKKLIHRLQQLRDDVRGAVFVEYVLLITLVGIGVICGLATLKTSLIAELHDLANAIGAIVCP